MKLNCEKHSDHDNENACRSLTGSFKKFHLAIPFEEKCRVTPRLALSR
ncbi:hypothetical protein [Enterobacter cloacae]|nr:hypothetical protein [Enterobacter cloacae]